MLKRRIGVTLLVSMMVLLIMVSVAFTKTTLVVATEDRPLQRVISNLTPEFEKMTDIIIQYVYYPSAELRSKMRLDASLGTGEFQVMYITEASINEMGSNGWLVPIKEFYPEKYDFNDFLPSIVNILSDNGIDYGAPLQAETTWLMYRKDLFEKDGIKVPVTLDEYIKVCQHFYQPPDMFGGVVRGDRGHGYNVWRWNQFFAVCGGKYMEDGKWVFDKYIDAAVKATEYYIEVIKTSPPGGEKFSYLDAWDAFNAGRVATFIGASAKYGTTENPEESLVAGKVGYAPPPYYSNPVAAGGAHGYVISSVGCKTDDMRKLAGEFIGWATSKEMELARVKDGKEALNCTRKSTFESEEFKKQIPAEVLKALSDTLAINVQVPPTIPQWPEIGDNLGVILEELFTGTRKDIKVGLEEANAFALKILGTK